MNGATILCKSMPMPWGGGFFYVIYSNSDDISEGLHCLFRLL